VRIVVLARPVPEGIMGARSKEVVTVGVDELGLCGAALGVSGALQHRVGMQAADTIVAVNRDPDGPPADDADRYVVGDPFEVGPALAAELRSRQG
jgi:electron transfer flavoprotein alpha subunit